MHRVEKDPLFRHFIERSRLGAFQKWCLYVTTIVLWLSGLAWIVAHHWMAQSGEFGDLPSPVEPMAMKVHGAVAMLFLVVFGAIIPIHVRRGWVLHRNRLSGAVVVGICAVLALTGWWLYYVPGDAPRHAASLVHIIVGLSLPGLIVLHILAWRWSSRVGARPSND